MFIRENLSYVAEPLPHRETRDDDEIAAAALAFQVSPDRCGARSSTLPAANLSMSAEHEASPSSVSPHGSNDSKCDSSSFKELSMSGVFEMFEFFLQLLESITIS